MEQLNSSLPPFPSLYSEKALSNQNLQFFASV